MKTITTSIENIFCINTPFNVNNVVMGEKIEFARGTSGYSIQGPNLEPIEIMESMVPEVGLEPT